jgi:predicted transposase/invertase (TIGR01784 family)
MPRDIDPKSDFVFKLPFGNAENVFLLLHLLRAIVGPTREIVSVTHVDPATRATFPGDDVTIVDVAAVAPDGALFQVEVQLQVRAPLRKRILYASADVLQAQLQRGSAWEGLRPLVVVWILAVRLFVDLPGWRHCFGVRSREGVELSGDLEVHVLELPKWKKPEVLDDLDRWAYFLRDARGWEVLPSDCRTPPLEKAMAILFDIAKDQEMFRAHRRRMAEHDRASAALELAETRAEVTAARAEVTAARAEVTVAQAEAIAAHAEVTAAQAEAAARAAGEVRALAEVEALRARLRAAGLE